MNVSGGSISSIDLSNQKIAVAIDNNVKLYSYSIGSEIKITDLESKRTENSHLGSIDYIRATGVPSQFVTCTCDNNDEVKVWNTQGGKVMLEETQRVGHLGNLALVTSKVSRLVLVPGKSSELRIYKANEAASKKKEYLEKLYFVKVSSNASYAAGISDDGQFLSATDSKSIYGWRLNERQGKMEEVFTIKADKEVKALDALRPVNDDNYHYAFPIVAYTTGKQLNVIAFKETKEGYEEIGKESIEAHTSEITRVKLGVVNKKVLVMTIASDKCIKMWHLPNDLLPPCILIWNP